MFHNLVKYFVFVCLTSTAALVRAESIVVQPSTQAACTGSLILTSPPRFGSPKHRILTEELLLDGIKNFPKKVVITKVEVHGCGCFQVFKNKNGKGKSFFLGLGSNQTIRKGDPTFFRKAKSVKRVKCSNKH